MRSHRLNRLALLTQGAALVGLGLSQLACGKDAAPPNEPIHVNATATSASASASAAPAPSEGTPKRVNAPPPDTSPSASASASAKPSPSAGLPPRSPVIMNSPAQKLPAPPKN